jgi:hypothetical protein
MAPEAVSYAINGCAAQYSGQLLMFEGKSCSYGREFTNSFSWCRVYVSRRRYRCVAASSTVFAYADNSKIAIGLLLYVFDTGLGPPTGPHDDPFDLGQVFNKVFLST